MSVPAPPAAGVRRTAIWLLPACVVAVLLAVLEFRVDFGVFTPDTKPELYLDPWGTFLYALSPVTASPSLGMENFNVGVAPYALFLSAVHLVVGEAWLLQRLLHVALGVLAFVGAWRLCREWLDRSQVACTAAGLVYVLAPYAVVSGATLPVWLPHAVLPWLLVAERRAFTAGAPRWFMASAVLWFGAMTGINAGSVSLTLSVGTLVLGGYALVVQRGSRARVLSRIGLVGVGQVLISAYWLVPGLFSSATGVQVAQTTESLEAIASTSSWSEVVRGLGFWGMYGGDARGPWNPGFVAYATSPWLVAAAVVPLLLAVLAVRRHGRATALLVALMMTAAVVMVGLHPAHSPAPFGRALAWAFDQLPFLVVLRTTNKAGSLFTLSVAALAGGGLAVLMARARRWGTRYGRYGPVRAQALLGAAGLAALGVLAAPVLDGQQHQTTMKIPGYWYQAAEDINATASRLPTWFLPGTALTEYRWGYRGPDDVMRGLVDGRYVSRVTVPASTPAANDFLAGVDVALARGDASADLVSTAARYLGVGEVVLRADIDSTASGAIAPGELERRLEADPGLRRVAAYGDVPPEWSDPRDTQPPSAALIRYAVLNPWPASRTRPVDGTRVVAGAPSSLADLSAGGLLAGAPPVRLASSMTPAEAARLAQSGARFVLTDGGQRRDVQSQRVEPATSPLLTEDQPAPGGRPVSSSTRDQTVLEYDGDVASATATSSGSVFGLLPYGGPSAAVDGDPSTAWLTGDFATGAGESLTVHLREPRHLSRVDVVLADRSPEVITALRVKAGGAVREVPVPQGALELAVELDGVLAESVQAEIVSTSGGGANSVGIAELSMTGVNGRPVVRLPVTLTDLVSRMSPAERQAFDSAPTDVDVERWQNRVDTPEDDEETVWVRRVTLPSDGTFLPVAQIRSRGISEADADRMTGRAGTVVARSTTRLGDEPRHRASQALDGDPQTGWAPGQGVGDRLTVTFPERALGQVSIVQPEGRVGIHRVRLFVDGSAEGEFELDSATTLVPLAARTAQSIELEVLDMDQGGDSIAQISELGLGLKPVNTRDDPGACLQVGSWGGAPLRVAVDSPSTLFAAGRSGTVACPISPTATVAAGAHILEVGAAPVVDRLTLFDAVRFPREPLPPTEVLSTWTNGDSKAVLSVPGGTPAGTLTLGLADLGWRLEGATGAAGLPVNDVDMFSAGWSLPAGEAVAFAVTYPTRFVTTVALAVSAVLALLLILVAGNGIRRPSAAPEDPRRRARADDPADSAGRRGRELPLAVVWTLVLVGVGLTQPWALVLVAPVLLVTLRVGRDALAMASAVLFASVPVAIVVVRGWSPSGTSFAAVSGDAVSPVLAAAACWLLVALATGRGCRIARSGIR